MHITYLLPFSTAAMVVPEAVTALVTHPLKETFQIEGGVGFVVNVAIRIAADLTAYQIGGE